MNKKRKEEEYILRIPKFTINHNDIAILIYCLEHEHTVSEIGQFLNMAPKNITSHLKKLKKYKFIKVEDNGKGKKKLIKTNMDHKGVRGFIYLVLEENEKT